MATSFNQGTVPWGGARRALNRPVSVLSKPSDTFEEALTEASWGSVWGHLLSVSAVLAIVEGITSSLANGITTLVVIPLFFFAWLGILYGVAKAFSGQGTFLAQSYTSLLFLVPFGIASGILTVFFDLLPLLPALNFAMLIYGFVLQVFGIKVVHGLSGGKAATVVSIPTSLAFSLALAGFYATSLMEKVVG